MYSKGAIFIFKAPEGFRKTPPCRVQLSFEPAFAGWVPPPEFSLGLSLSLPSKKIGTLYKSVGSKPRCGITRTAGQFIYTIKRF